MRILALDHGGHGGCCAEEVRVVCVDVCALYRDERFDIVGCWTETFSEKVRHHFDELAL